MGCTSCSPGGCGDKGHCATGGCNKMNTYDWISTMDLSDPTEYNYVEVSFKLGARKEFYANEHGAGRYNTGDWIVVEAQTGYDLGQISLMGELVRMQMKKKHTSEDRVLGKIIRVANERDIEKLEEARNSEKRALVRARSIAYTMGLDMKIGDVEYQGDMRKATFFYTAKGRVDFRELVKSYVHEFRVKIEMRQIGSRQESARIGGLGSCGRELCCSTWLSDFKSVNTAAARYQNISINQTKLSGQCGRLKCCLNYELDTYMDALQYFPVKADHIYTQKGRATLMKTDIFKGIMFYCYDDINMRGVFHPLDKEQVKTIQAMNAKNIQPEDLTLFYDVAVLDKPKEVGYEDVTGQIELPSIAKKKSNNKNKRKGGDRNQNPNLNNNQQNSGSDRPKKIVRKADENTGSNSGSSAATDSTNNSEPNSNPNAPNNSGTNKRKGNWKNRNKNKGDQSNNPNPNNNNNTTN